MQVLYLGRAPRTKETLPDFLKWRRVTRPPLVFRGLTGSQRTPGFWGVTVKAQEPITKSTILIQKHRIKGDFMLILTKLEFFNSISFKPRVRINS